MTKPKSKSGGQSNTSSTKKQQVSTPKRVQEPNPNDEHTQGPQELTADTSTETGEQSTTALSMDQQPSTSQQSENGENSAQLTEEVCDHEQNNGQHAQPPPDNVAADDAEDDNNQEPEEECLQDEQQENQEELMDQESSDPFANLFTNIPRTSVATHMLHRKLTGSNRPPPRGTDFQTMFQFMEMFWDMKQGQVASGEGNPRKRTRPPSPPTGSEYEQGSPFRPIQVKQEGVKRNKQSGRLAQGSSQKGLDSKSLSLCRDGAAIPSAHLACENKPKGLSGG